LALLETLLGRRRRSTIICGMEGLVGRKPRSPRAKRFEHWVNAWKEESIGVESLNHKDPLARALHQGRTRRDGKRFKGGENGETGLIQRHRGNRKAKAPLKKGLPTQAPTPPLKAAGEVDRKKKNRTRIKYERITSYPA